MFTGIGTDKLNKEEYDFNIEVVEENKVAIRNIRRDLNDAIKKLGLTEGDDVTAIIKSTEVIIGK